MRVTEETKLWIGICVLVAILAALGVAFYIVTKPYFSESVIK